MATSTASIAPDAYAQMGQRIQKIINGQAAQRSRAALIARLPHEAQEDWDTLLAEIAENDNVTLAHRDDGAVQLFWTVPSDD